MDSQGIAAYGHSFAGTSQKFKAKYVKFTLRHPIAACINYSNYMTLASKPINYLLRYVSIVGSHSINKASITSIMNQTQKENSLEMLSHFFKGKFSNAFKQIAREPEVVEKIKDVFSKIASLLETKEDLIKPIFISLCMENASLCKWVFQEQLLYPEFKNLTNAQIKFMGELVMAQNTPESFVEKMEMVRSYLFTQVKDICEENIKICSEDHQTNLNKLSKIYSKGITQFNYKFPKSELELKPLVISDEEIDSLLKYKTI